MPRAKLITQSVPLTIHLPGDLHARLALYLLSPSLGRIPYGAWQKFFTERTEEFFTKLTPPSGQ